MLKNGMRPVHPGEVLREDYLKPLGLSVNALAKRLHVPASRMNDIVLERPGSDRTAHPAREPVRNTRRRRGADPVGRVVETVLRGRIRLMDRNRPIAEPPRLDALE